MSRFTQLAAALTVGFLTSTAIAAPQSLIIHNLTNVESNAYVAGIYPSPSPTKPNTTSQISWYVVKLACFGHTTEGKCPALVKMATDTANPVELGTVSLDLESGEITPSRLSANGYTLTVDGPGEATLSNN
jgi:hypothetical protein